MPVKTVAVIGSGFAGLTAVKACLEQGLDVTCYEMHDDLGGIWYFTEHYRPNEGATAYEYLISNTSREIMRYSDFNFPPDAPTFPTCDDVHKYLRAYAEKFGVSKTIQFNTKVVGLRKARDYEETGRWICQIERQGEDTTESKAFDAVVVSIGFHRKPFIPKIEDFSKFCGEWSHSIKFKCVKPFVGKSVLIIGNANSALDAATGLTDHAKQVYISVGQGCWVLTRNINGLPYDTFTRRRIYVKYSMILDRKWRKACEDNFNHKEFGIRAATGPLRHYPTINDDIGSRIASGKIKIVSRTVRFLQDGVQLEDGRIIPNIEHVLFATGFEPDHSLLDADTMMNSYKQIFPINLPRSTLALVGMLSSKGPFAPAAEMQARYVSLVFSGKHKLPDIYTMETDIKRWKPIQDSLYGPGKHWIPTLPLADEIATMIGVYPSFWKVFRKSPKVAFQTIFGPAFAAQYRLVGDGSTQQAVDECLNAWELSHQGVKLRKVPPLSYESWWPVYKQIFVLVVTVCGVFLPFYWQRNRLWNKL